MPYCRPSARRFAWPILVALAAGCGREAQPSSIDEQGADATIPAVEIVQARTGTLPLYERFTGTVRASGEVAIFPETEGVISRVLAQNGDEVRRGQTLIEIRAPGSEEQLAQARFAVGAARAELKRAEANLQELEAQFKRNQVLGREGLVSAELVETQRAQVDAARAAVAAARAQVDVAEATFAERLETRQQTIVRAPISGRVGGRNAEVGMRVDPQTQLFVIGRLENMRVEVPVTQEIVTRVREGQRVEIGVPGGARPIEARVSRISPFLQAGSFSAEVEIDVPNDGGRLVPGMFVTVDIFYGQSDEVTLVPTSALYTHPTSGAIGAFVTNGPPPAAAMTTDGPGVRREDPIEIAYRQIEVVAEGPLTAGVEGIQPGEWVVVIGQHLLAAQGDARTPRAYARTIEWDRILELQRLQREDLLREFMDKQQRLARQRARAEGESGGL